MPIMRAVFLAGFALAVGVGPALGDDAIKAYTGDLPPWTIPANKAKPGFAYEVMSEMVKRSGLKIDIEVIAWRRGQQEIQNTPNTLGFHIYRSPDRETQYTWYFSILESPIAFFSTGKAIDSVADAKAHRVVVVAGTPQEVEMKQAGATKLDVVEKVEAAVRMLEAGRVDAFYTFAERALYSWSEAGYPLDKLVMGKQTRTDPLFIAGHKQMPAGSIEKLKAAFESMKADGSFAAIYRKYFGDRKPG